ncbi:hypothetical protein NCAS_0I01060 [Naumovozyma castellii]|uniref:Transcription and mRNA export factor SUS1 n=1 Tax=Naumovozyma castellii TaxID=27288 RepID=G0VJU3_NAUCA|nr:hypothetical protein NCAS_0I01060 [Naumovozyma castellii CBS 4309]CCC71774.1 hypothetical protein NCAS_0I01060 [Naumovozyma castellii CBS 4309]
MSEINSMKAQIQKYLVESGNYELISKQLTESLLREGWIDKVKTLTKEELQENKSLNYTELLSKIEPKALDMVSDSTKTQALQKIKVFLDQVVDTE